jgi:OOP family OmpA-OmpF porin
VLAAIAALMLFGRRRTPLETTMPAAPKEVPRAETPRAPEIQQPAPPPVMGGGPSATVTELNQFFADTNEATPKRIPLEGVNFDHDSDRLGPASAGTIDGVAATLKAHPTAQVRIDGYTDESGNTDYDKLLSANRANAVREALIRRGVDPQRITIAGNGAEQPVAPNDTEQGRAQNRRIDIVVTSR